MARAVTGVLKNGLLRDDVPDEVTVTMPPVGRPATMRPRVPTIWVTTMGGSFGATGVSVHFDVLNGGAFAVSGTKVTP